MGNNVKRYISLIRDNLTEDLRKPQYRGNPNIFAGQCYVASEALYHLLGGKNAGYTPMVIQMMALGTHWFLRGPDGEILDPTVDQFYVRPAYEQARPCGFLTKEPSKRTRVLLKRIQGK